MDVVFASHKPESVRYVMWNCKVARAFWAQIAAG